MAKTAKKKHPTAPTISDLQQAEGAVAEYARLALRKKGLDVGESEAAMALKERYESERAPVEARMDELEAALKGFATLNRTEVFGEKQTLTLAFGSLEFRKSTKTVQISGVKAEDTLAKVKALGFTEAISVKESLNTEAMERWTEERLALVGRRRATSESFSVKPHEDVA